ncbi:hypothetical protein HPB47_025210 [Ixodes persulcatus]|uniref:Uncharacterized protein n=1 Tax=Ixodes persulcatus TaxID=34615 RepID=A0AC60Q246_IXOPE|nr:hypothetical protein HPB47_025210 [Ixodes persulcatus]
MDRLRRKRAVIRSAVTRATNELQALLDSSDATAGELTENFNIPELKEAALKAVESEIEDGVDIDHLEEEMESVEVYQVSICRLRTRTTLKLDTPRTPNIVSNAVERTAQTCTLQLADSSCSGFKGDIGIDIPIGADNYWKAVTGSIKRPDEDLTAVKTIFGWTLQGPVRPLPEVGWHQATVMQVMTRHQSDRPSQQLRERNTPPVLEDDMPEPKQSTIKSEPVPEEAAGNDSDMKSDKTEALECAPCTPKLSSSDSKEDSGIFEGNVMSNDGEGDEATLTGTVETQGKILKPVNLISVFTEIQAGKVVGVDCKKCRKRDRSGGSMSSPLKMFASQKEQLNCSANRKAGEDVDAVVCEVLCGLIEKSGEGSSGLLGEKISTETLRHLLRTFRENDDYRYQDFVSDEAGLNLSALFEQPLVKMQDIAIKKHRRDCSDHGSSSDHGPEVPPRMTRKRRKCSTPVPEKRTLTRSQRRRTCNLKSFKFGRLELQSAKMVGSSDSSGIQVGDVVLLRNDHRPGTFWDLAVVDKTFPG